MWRDSPVRRPLFRPLPKAALKPPHSKRCRAGPVPSTFAKRLECGAFTAAFSLTADVLSSTNRSKLKSRVIWNFPTRCFGPIRCGWSAHVVELRRVRSSSAYQVRTHVRRRRRRTEPASALGHDLGQPALVPGEISPNPSSRFEPQNRREAESRDSQCAPPPNVGGYIGRSVEGQTVLKTALVLRREKAIELSLRRCRSEFPALASAHG